MKLLTLNTHSLVEKNYSNKLKTFVNTIFFEKPDIIALQEVNQSRGAEPVSLGNLTGYIPCTENTVIRKDNHIFNAVKMLEKMGLNYCWTWLPIKNGYGKFDEGIGIMSLPPITETDTVTVSVINDYNNWKTRRIIGAKVWNQWIYSVHYGWWNDGDERFEAQWNNTLSHLKHKKKIWLMGDFNNPADIRGEGYDMVLESGFYDSFLLSDFRDNGITVGGIIDGWRDKINNTDGMRIDFIMCNEKRKISTSKIIFNGNNYPVISDHYGVIIETGEDTT